MSQYNNNNTSNDIGQNYDRESEEGSTVYTPSSREERENDLLMITKLTRLKKVYIVNNIFAILTSLHYLFYSLYALHRIHTL